MLALTQKDVTRLLDWYRELRRQKLDVLADEDLAQKLWFEQQRLYELERTQ